MTHAVGNGRTIRRLIGVRGMIILLAMYGIYIKEITLVLYSFKVKKTE